MFTFNYLSCFILLMIVIALFVFGLYVGQLTSKQRDINDLEGAMPRRRKEDHEDHEEKEDGE